MPLFDSDNDDDQVVVLDRIIAALQEWYAPTDLHDTRLNEACCLYPLTSCADTDDVCGKPTVDGSPAARRGPP